MPQRKASTTKKNTKSRSKKKHYMKNPSGEYKNGQKISEQKGDWLTYFFKTGTIKAKGKSIDGVMQGKWVFNRESGQLWQIGNFKNNKKHGEFIRYDREGEKEYHARFKDGKLVSQIL